jgi:recombination protein RecA
MSTTANKLLAGLKKSFGDSAKISMAADLVGTRSFRSSGSLALDFALGNGGWPTNRLVEICGPEHVGKTSLAMLTMRTFLLAQPERYGLLLDCEHKSDAEWVSQLIGEELMERMIIVQPLHIEQATDMYTQSVGGDPAQGIPSGMVCCAVLDSIGGAPSMQSVNKSAEIGTMGGNAQGVGRFARAAASHSNIYDCLTIGINQVRDHFAMPNAINRPGGHAWKHAITQAVQLSKAAGRDTQKIHGEDVLVGQEVKGRVIKNGCAAPGRVARWWFYNIPTEGRGVGIDTFEEIERLSILTGVVERGGSWYKHLAFTGGQVKGKEGLKAALRDESTRMIIVSETMARLADHASEVAPMETDPEVAPVTVGMAALATGAQ